MIKFIIDKIQLRNVRNYGDNVMEMDFPVDNLTVFTGHVGAGKSTILKAVSMALYGDDGGVKGEKLSIDDMVNERTGKNLEIHLFFRSIDTLNNDHIDNYEIHLYHKHSKMNNKLVFMKNGIDISANGKMDTYRLIEKTTIPKEVYHNIYYFTQQAKNFFTALPNSEQKAIFDSILDLSDYDKYYENCRNQIREYDQKISECELKIKMFESNISEKSSMIESEKNNIENLNNENKKRIDELSNEITNLKTKYDSLINENELFENSKSITESMHSIESNSKIAILNLTNDISNLETKITSIKDKYQKLFNEEKSKAKDELDNKNNPIKENIKDLELKHNDLKHQKDKDICDINNKNDTELMNISNSYKDKKNDYQQKIKDFERELVDYASKIKSDYLNESNKVSSIISKIKDTINDLNIEISKCNSDKNELEFKNEDYQKLYNRNRKQLESDTPYCDKCGQPLINLDRLKNEQSEIEKNIDVNNQKINEISNKLIILENDKVKENNSLKDTNDKLISYKNEIVSQYNIKKADTENKIIKIKKDIEASDIAQKNEIDIVNDKYKNMTDEVNVKYKKIFDVIEQDIKLNNDNIELNINNTKNKLIKISQDFTKKLNDETSAIRDEIDNKMAEKSKVTNTYNLKLQDLKKQLDESEKRDQKISDLKQYISEKLSELKIKKEFKVSKETLNSLQNSIETDKVKYEEYKKSKKELDKTLEILEFWKTAFSDSGIKSMLIDVAIPHMNQCVREELERVCPGTFTVSFDTLSETKSGNIRDKFSINIVHNIKCATGHKKLSGGEKRIIDFCCMSALRSLAEKLYGKMFSHIFYDEVLDSLDSESRELFCRSMKHQSNDHRNITLVTHALTEDVDPDRIFPF